MACRSATTARVDLATRLLLKGHSGPHVVSELAEREGLSRRQARRYVALGYKQIVADVEDAGIDRIHVTAQTIHMLQEAAARAMEHNNPSAAVGACRVLMELIRMR